MKKYEAIEGSDKKLKIEVFYDKGGMNYYNGATNKRGYYVSARVVEIQQGEGYTSESFMMFGGLKQFLFEVKKQSQKAYEKAIEMATTMNLDGLKAQVLADPSNKF